MLQLQHRLTITLTLMTYLLVLCVILLEMSTFYFLFLKIHLWNFEHVYYRCHRIKSILLYCSVLNNFHHEMITCSCIVTNNWFSWKSCNFINAGFAYTTLSSSKAGVWLVGQRSRSDQMFMIIVLIWDEGNLGKI